MSSLRAGFARVNVNPMMGIDISGYFIERKAEGFLDDLEANALALESDGTKAVLISIDNLGIKQDIALPICEAVCRATGLASEAVFLNETHTHTGPEVKDADTDPLQGEYVTFLTRRICDVAQAALADLKPARMGYGMGQAPNIAFVRRFRMKDGGIRTNPGVDNPDIVEPIGEVDERVNVVRFDREGGDTLVLVNFGNHPDVVGGCKISADWPGFVRRTVEKTLDGTKCIFFNGAQGDVNHVNVHPRGGYLNDMFMDFDDVARGYAHSRYIGRVVTAGVLQTFDKVQYVEAPSLRVARRPIRVPSNMPRPEDLPEARRIHALHTEGRDEEIPYCGMMLTTVVAEAARMVRLEHGPAHFDMILSGLSLGPVAMLGIPGEPFTGIGRALKETEGYEMVCPMCCTNGYEGYFPMQEAYDEGGYESRSSAFRAGVAEYVIAEGKTLLGELNKK